MSYSIMDSYQLGPGDFPLTVYRVDYPGAQTTWSPRWGFQAASTFTPLRAAGLRNAVQYHLDWQNRVTSPFISVFGSWQHAKNWANRWFENNNQICYLVEIRLEANDDIRVLRVRTLVDRLGITTRLDPSQYHSEYLCFQRIPSEVVIRRIPIGQVSYDSGSDEDSYGY
ncbi:hypothetical protein CPB86DRAFT_793410 [Serendipita vermifera]|nr:hypothetical protein CPB86DRAFT_793410 [Serendipita vermifera]